MERHLTCALRSDGVSCAFIRADDDRRMGKSKDGQPADPVTRQIKEVARLEATVEAYKSEIRRLVRAVERAEEDAAKWRRKAKKLKKRESTVIAEAAPELAALPALGDTLSA
jgi:predicted RNase H-like nuclease (RuvC/YqgF family)